MKPKISVIMSVYNPHPYAQLEDAAASILRQTEKDWEFLIYDDGSEEAVREKLRCLAGSDPRIRLLEGDRNRGIAWGLNQCLANARGEYIARMDADDLSLPGRLKIQAEFLDSHPEYDYIGCNAFLFDNAGVWGIRRMPAIPEKEDFLAFSPYIHPSVMFRRTVFETCGAYNTSRQMLRCEDYEIFMRMHIMGCRGYNLQKELFCYREDEAGYRRRKFRRRIDEIRLRKKGFHAMGLTGPRAWLCRYRPLIGAVLPPGLYRRIKQGQSRIGEA